MTSTCVCVSVTSARTYEGDRKALWPPFRVPDQVDVAYRNLPAILNCSTMHAFLYTVLFKVCYLKVFEVCAHDGRWGVRSWWPLGCALMMVVGMCAREGRWGVLSWRSLECALMKVIGCAFMEIVWVCARDGRWGVRSWWSLGYALMMVVGICAHDGHWDMRSWWSLGCAFM